MEGFDEWARIQKLPLPDGSIKFKLLRDLMYRSTAGSVYVVKEGFVSDLLTIPRCLWWLIPPHKYPSAAILHDYFCRESWISRADGDQLFYEALLHSNAPNWKAKVMYWCVRLYALTFNIK